MPHLVEPIENWKCRGLTCIAQFICMLQKTCAPWAGIT